MLNTAFKSELFSLKFISVHLVDFIWIGARERATYRLIQCVINASIYVNVFLLLLRFLIDHNHLNYWW